MSIFRYAVGASIVGLLGLGVACGSTAAAPTKPDPTGLINPEAGIIVDAGADANGALPPDPLDPNYPTSHTPIPLVDYNGGPILKAPNVITITYDGDTLRDDLETFGGMITQSKWWDAVREGYCDGNNNCVGQGTNGGTVHLSTPPAASYTDSASSAGGTLQTMIQGFVADGTFPAPDENTLYVIYFPSTVSITLDGAGSCSEFGGYHNSTNVRAPAQDGGAAPAAVEVAYAILPRCSSSEPELTIAASHEVIEASTDPLVSAPAYYMRNQLWAFLGGEVGDLCVSYSGDDSYQESGFTVQRTWSNKAAAASHDPCVPAPDPKTTPYFNVAPATGQDSLDLKIGASKTIQLTGFSDGEMPADWNVDAQEFSNFQGGTDVLSFAFDRQNAHNGSKLNLTVTLMARPTAGNAVYAITSKSGSTEHTWPMQVFSE